MEEPQSLIQLEQEHHHPQWVSLRYRWQQERVLPSVLLLSGPPEVGKKAAARGFAQSILCTATERKPEDLPCGHCTECKSVQSGYSILFHTISSPKIDAFYELKSSALLKPYSEQPFFICIPQVNNLTLPAAQSLLKILEEPPRLWCFLLTVSHPKLLLPTLLSRCQMVSLKPFSKLEIHQNLTKLGAEPEKIQIGIKLAQGSLRRAWKFIQPDLLEKRKHLFPLFTQPAAVFPFTDLLLKSDENLTPSLFNFLEQLLETLLKWSIQKNPSLETLNWPESDGRSFLVEHIQILMSQWKEVSLLQKHWISLVEHLEETQRELESNSNRKRVLQDFFFHWISPWGKLKTK